MKRALGAALSMLCCLPAMADWRSLGNVGNAEVFVDPAGIVRSGDSATMWSLYALKTPGTVGSATYVSLKRQDEFDCKGARIRAIQIAAYPEPMAEGKPVSSEQGTAGWVAVTPQSAAETLWKVACNKE